MKDLETRQEVLNHIRNLIEDSARRTFHIPMRAFGKSYRLKKLIRNSIKKNKNL